jgi:hypothetical protein
MARKKKNRPERPMPGPKRLSVYDRCSGPLIAEKIENLKLIRAMDVAGVGLGRVKGLSRLLVKFAEYDALLVSGLEALDDTGRTPGEPGGEGFLEFAEAGRTVRAMVLQVFPPAVRRAVEAAMDRVAASEAEVWMEVEALRRLKTEDAEAGPDGPSLFTDEEVDALAAILDRGKVPRVNVDERVERQESKPLPRAFEIEPWLARLPVGWLRTIARMLDVLEKRPKAQLVRRIAAALRTPETLRMVLRERLGDPERWMLARLYTEPYFLVEELPEDVDESFAVPWDWHGGLPPGTGAKLRAFGLAYVGSRYGERLLSYPGELAELVNAALMDVDPDTVREVKRELGDVADACIDDLLGYQPESRP